LLEVLREEEVVQLEEELLRRLEEKLTPLVQQAASDAAKVAMHQLRLDLMGHISRHEDTIRRLKRSEAALNHVPTSR
jgi:CHASE3 domain sensor protein